VWVHDHSGDHQVAFNGSAMLIGGQASSRAIFSPDGSKLFFFGSRNSDEKRELWQADLRSGQVEPILPGFSPAQSFDISPDGNQLVFDSYDADGTFHLWLAWLDRHSPPEVLRSKLAEGSPVFGPRGDIYYEGQMDGKVYLYRRSPSGSEIVRVTPRPVVRLESISPDGKWLVAEAAIEEETKRGVQAFNVEDGSIKRICNVLCLVRWATQGSFMFVAFPGNTMAASSYKTFIIPLHHGSVFPDLPPGGIKSEQDLMGLNGVKIVNDLLHPGSDNVGYAFDRVSDHRNIYRIPIR
jgi:WD40 repeat protein